jgi:hypothetical protein
MVLKALCQHLCRLQYNSEANAIHDLTNERSAMKPLPDHAWNAWSPDELAARLSGVERDWYIVGGWALDLWHGRQSRSHDDLEFAVLADAVDDFRESLGDLEFFVARDGTLSHLDRLTAKPSDVWQLWGADMSAGCWRVDMMVERGTPDIWQYKRDPSFQLSRSTAILTSAFGVPYLAPALVLLFKAKHRREKDDADFQTALPRLRKAEKADLRVWLDALHPGHAWIGRL